MCADRGLLITATNEYRDGIETLVCMLESLRRNDPEQEVRAYLYNFGQDTVDMLAKINPNAELVMREHNWPKAEVKLRMACVRTNLLQETIRQRSTAWIDTDVLIRKPLDPFWEMVSEPKTLAVTCRPKAASYLKVASGFVGLPKGRASLKFCCRWARNIPEHPEWYADQIALRDTIRETKFKTNPLPAWIHDLEWGDDSIVWHRRGIYRSHPIWLNEMNEYMRTAKERMGLA